MGPALVVAAVLLIAASSAVSSRLGVAAPLLLTVVGVCYSFLPGVPVVEVPPEVVLDVVLPVLVYAAAVQTPLTDFRRELRAIVGLSVVLVVLSAFLVALLLTVLIPPISFGVALAIGAVVSPTDAVAATTVAKRLGLPAPIVAILEGESLVNDAAALTLLRTALASVGAAFSGWRFAGEFGYSVLLALVLGGIVGVVGLAVRARLESTVVDTTVSFVLPFLAFVPAQALGASGVVATVVAGIIAGTAGPRYIGSRARISEGVNWRTVQFLLEGGVFLVMGAQLAPIVRQVAGTTGAGTSVAGFVGIAGLVILVLIVARALVVFALVAVSRREARTAPRRIARMQQELDRLEPSARSAASTGRSPRHARVLQRRIADLRRFNPSDLRWWSGVVGTAAGMRGVVTLAGAQSIPEGIPLRDGLILVAFTVAAATLLVQGGALPGIIRLSGLRGTGRDSLQQQAALLVGELTAAGLSVLDHPGRDADGEEFDERARARLRQEVGARRTRALKAIDRPDDGDETAYSHYQQLADRVAQAVQLALLDARARGDYSSDVIEQVQVAIDHDSSAPPFPTDQR